jgi:hypothetical protein
VNWLFALPITGSEPCAQIDPEMFFEESGAQSARNIPILRELCSTCPILDECREHGIRHEEFGFWGGMPKKERARERRRRGITLDSPSVVNDRVFYERMREVKERERDDLRRLPTRSDLQWRVAERNKAGDSAA